MFGNSNKPNPAVDGYHHPEEQQELGGAQSYANNQPQYPRPAGNQPPMAGKPNPLNLSMFAAACCVMVGSIVSFFSEFFSLQWVDAVEMTYIFLFGLTLAFLDTPLLPNHQFVRESQVSIQKYVGLLSRVTGKGAVYIFLGCALASSMWAKNKKSGLMIFVAVMIGFLVVLVGLMVLVLGLLKSRNLNLVRQELRKDGPEGPGLERLYTQHAKLHPQTGLTREEFKSMTPYARGVAFEDADLHLIFNAVSTSYRKEFITHDDLLAWVRSNWPVLL